VIRNDAKALGVITGNHYVFFMANTFYDNGIVAHYILCKGLNTPHLAKLQKLTKVLRDLNLQKGTTILGYVSASINTY